MKYMSQVFIGLGFLVLVAACGKNDNNNQNVAGTCQAGYVASTNGSQTYCCPQSGGTGQCYALNQAVTCNAGYVSNGQNQCCPQNGQGGCYTVAATPNQPGCTVPQPYGNTYGNTNYYGNNGCNQPYPPTGYPPTGYPPYGGSPYGNYGYPMPMPMPLPYGGFSASIGFGTGMGAPMPMPYGGYGAGMPTYFNQNGGYNNYGPY